MKNIKTDWTLHKELNRICTVTNYNCTISRKDFERLFTGTDEKVTFTFAGWDGKSYDGESRTSNVLRCSLKGYEDFRFIKVGKGLHMIYEDRMVTEIATGKEHPKCGWVIDIARA